MARFILFLLIGYFLYRFVQSFFKTSRSTTAFGNTSGGAGASQNPQQKVTIKYDPAKAKSKVGKDVGEYVDYEELKD